MKKHKGRPKGSKNRSKTDKNVPVYIKHYPLYGEGYIDGFIAASKLSRQKDESTYNDTLDRLRQLR